MSDRPDIPVVPGAEARTYYGAQGGMQVPPIRRKVGTEVASLEIGLSLTPEGELLLRGYDTRLAPAQLHCAVHNPETSALVGIGQAFDGVVDGTSLRTAELDGTSSATLRLVSSARRGTQTVVGVKSDQAQRRRSATDEFNTYSSLGTVASDPWGGRA